tara:strand:- start:2657 stop:2815 length:159 start_codon:yes stop_codon:yes gene_type:complete
MQTNSIKGNSISIVSAIGEIGRDMSKFGAAGIFRGQVKSEPETHPTRLLLGV